MAEVANDLIYEILKKIQADVSEFRHGQQNIRQELISMRGHMLSMQNDVHNIYLRFDRHDERLERIERRLEHRELAEPHAPFEHNR